MDELEREILAGDRRAILRAQKLGDAATPTLLALVGHADPDVREIALYSLGEVGGEGSAEALAAATLDPMPVVRGVALRGLLARPDPAALPAVLSAYDRSPEADVRFHLARVVGLMPDGSVSLATLRARRAHELYALPREGLLVALARLGDPDAREEVLRVLAALPERPARKRWLDHVEYVGQPWVLSGLRPFLDDETPALRIGADGIPDVPEYLRVCDLAVNLVATIGGAQLSFAVNRMTLYSPEQRAEAKAWLDANA